MANGQHRLSEIDEELLIGWCSVCETLVKVRKATRTKGPRAGTVSYRCRNAYKQTSESSRRPWRAHKKAECEECGFVALDPCQLHVDHIDGNKENNNPSNYRTLCANCHALKTHRKGDSVALAFRK